MDTSLFRRVRFYLTSRASDEELPIIRRAAEREFRLLQGMYHPGIPRAVNLVDHAWGPAVVFDHNRDWERFDQWLSRRGPGLTLAQRLTLVQDLAEIVDYAHSRRLAHRALNPRTIFVKNPDQPRPSLVVTDWQTGGRLSGATQVTRLSTSTDGAGLELFFDDETRRYQAPEATSADKVPGTQLDVFSLGVLAYRSSPATRRPRPPRSWWPRCAMAGLNLAAVVDGVPNSLATLIYDATRGDPAQRLSSVAQFRADLDKVWDELTAPEPEPVVDPLKAHKGDRARRRPDGARAAGLRRHRDRAAGHQTDGRPRSSCSRWPGTSSMPSGWPPRRARWRSCGTGRSRPWSQGPVDDRRAHRAAAGERRAAHARRGLERRPARPGTSGAVRPGPARHRDLPGRSGRLAPRHQAGQPGRPAPTQGQAAAPVHLRLLTGRSSRPTSSTAGTVAVPRPVPRSAAADAVRRRGRAVRRGRHAL